MSVRKLVFASVIGLALLGLADPATAVVPTVASAAGAGYRVTPDGGVATASTRFVVPEISCAHDNDFEVLYLGVFGLKGDNSTAVHYAEVFAACNNSSTPNYFGRTAIGDDVQNMVVTVGH